MIKVYCKKGCGSTKRALDWFRKYQIEIKTFRINHISDDDLVEILSVSTKGFASIVKSSSRISSKNKQKLINLKDMNFNEGIKYLIENPNLLQTPIILGEKKSLVGFNPDDIRQFLPKKYRRKIIQNAKT
ncbi:ArsC/Spx/MgsR family protein [Lactococcus garvieae]